jgi:hypothetical protein
MAGCVDRRGRLSGGSLPNRNFHEKEEGILNFSPALLGQREARAMVG